MTDESHTTNPDALPTPIVFERDGEVRTNSRDVAAMFDKRHDNVLRDVAALIEAEPGCLLSFEETPYLEPSNGQTYRSFEMSRDGFTLLAMGFTGAKALKFKLRYIEAFNSMEARLRGLTDPMQVLADPQAMRGLLLSYSEKVIALEDRVSDLEPKADALDRIATSDGSLCITDAAKTLQVQPKALFAFLRSHRWIYSRAGGAGEIAYQDKLASGLLEHKTTTVHRSDGSEKTASQVRVTPKGLTRLAREFLPVAIAA